MRLTKENSKVPICDKCGRVMKGRIPLDATDIECFMCYNKRRDKEDEEKLTNWKDKE